jgi:hypothetical protein
MIDSSFATLPFSPGNKTELKINAAGQVSVLSGYVQNAFARCIRTPKAPSNVPSQLIYTIEDAKVSYADVFRDGLFGDMKMLRTAVLRGNYITGEVKDSLHRFNYTQTDTVLLDSRQEIESGNYGFLSPAVPANSSFGSIWEPAAIVATIGVAVYLLFSVRKTN